MHRSGEGAVALGVISIDPRHLSASVSSPLRLTRLKLRLKLLGKEQLQRDPSHPTDAGPEAGREPGPLPGEQVGLSDADFPA